MKKIFIFLFIFCAILCLFSVNRKANAQSSTNTTTPVTIIGDSLSVGASQYYKSLIPNVTVDAMQGRHWSEGISILSAHATAPVVVYELGTNDSSLSPSLIDHVLNAAPNAQIFFVTTYDSVKPDWATAVNATLQSAASAHSDRVKLIYWDALASKNPQWFKTDPLGIHPIDGDGYQQYGNLIAQTVNGTAAGTSSGANALGPGVYESDSLTITHRVGNPTETAGNASDVLTWAQKINAVEEQGVAGRWNRMVADISNNGYSATKRTGQIDGGLGSDGIYWCTFLVIDSFNLAGSSGITTSNGAAAVIGMIGIFKQNAGYQYLDYLNQPQVLNQVHPGYAVFFQKSAGATGGDALDHAAIVKSLSVNTHGDGTIETLDANTSGSKDITYPVAGGAIQVSWGDTVVGFGTTK